MNIVFMEVDQDGQFHTMINAQTKDDASWQGPNGQLARLQVFMGNLRHSTAVQVT